MLDGAEDEANVIRLGEMEAERRKANVPNVP